MAKILLVLIFKFHELSYVYIYVGLHGLKNKVPKSTTHNINRSALYLYYFHLISQKKFGSFPSSIVDSNKYEKN